MKLSRNVIVLGIVSFLTDVSSEMIYPLIPVFLGTVLGAGKSVIGVIEGIAESTASILKIFSGVLSDKLKNRKTITFAGYWLSAISKIFLITANAWQHVLAVRFAERAGKGIRTSPRDALIAECTDKDCRGLAFGFHRMMDTMGAALGPLLSALILFWFAGNLESSIRLIFLLAVIPAIIGACLIPFFVKETHSAPKPAKLEISNNKFQNSNKNQISEKKDGLSPLLDRRFKIFLLAIAVFAIGNSSDVFLILRAQDLGMKVALIPIVYFLFNVIGAVVSFPAGIVSDKIGRKPVIAFGFIIFSAVYFGFGFANSQVIIWLLFGLYGFYDGATHGVMKAFVSDVAPKERKATAFGFFHFTVGILALPASIIAGVLWERVGPGIPFFFGGITSMIAFILLLFL